MKPINLHGVGGSRKPVGIARLVAPKVIEHQVAGRSRVVICIDREQRSECAPGLARAIAGALDTELRAHGRSTDGVQVVVADRAFEAWILADAAGLRERGVFKAAPRFRSFEGQLGARSRLGAVEIERLLGRPYDKAIHGPALFTQISFADARRHESSGRGSRSLDKLLRALGV